MLCHDYLPDRDAGFRACCPTTGDEPHDATCNRAQEALMVATAEARVRVGRQHRGDTLADWRPAPRTVHDITMWDAPHDAAAIVPVVEGADALEEELAEELESDPELEELVGRLRVLGWTVLLIPIGACSGFRAGEAFGAHLPLAPSVAGAWGQVMTVACAVVLLGWIVSELLDAPTANASAAPLQ